MKTNPTGFFIVQLASIFIRLIGWLLFMAGVLVMFGFIVNLLGGAA